MIVVLSDTHSKRPPELATPVRTAIDSADCLIHAGDFTSNAVVDTFAPMTERFVAIAGNRDSSRVTDRLPKTATISYEGVRIAVTHHVAGGDVARSLFGREQEVSVLITGHTHRPSVATARSVRLLNPGSHRRPRGGPPTFLTLDVTANHGQLHTTDGTRLEEFPVRPPDR